MANATYLVEVDWNLDGDFTDTYDDITADVKSIHFSRGKSDELGKAEVGQCSITVKNATGKYTPGAGGVISTLLLPKRPIRVRTTAPGAYNLFYGFIEEIIPHPHLAEQDCIITATDGLDYLARADMATELVKNHLTGSIHTAILYKSDWPTPTSTSGLVLNAPLFMPNLDGVTFYSDDNYKHLCTVTGTTWGATGRTFDGDDLIDCGIVATLAFTGDFSIELWQSQAAVGGYGLFNKYITGGAAGYMLYTEGGGYVSVRTAPDGAYSYVGGLGTGWRHITVSKSGSTITFYIDGAKKGDGAGVHNNVDDSGTSVRVGVKDNINTSPFTGIVGEVRAYNRALTAAEILQRYNLTKWRYQGLIDAGQDTVPYWYGADVKARFAQEEIDDSEQGFSYVDGAGYFRFEDRYHRSTATHQTSQGTFDNTMANITYSLNPRNVYNIVKVTVTPWTLLGAAEPHTTLWTLQETPTIPVGEAYTYWGEASVSGTPVFVDAWATLNDGATDYTISGTFTIAQTNFAKSIKIVITNTGTIPNVITLLQARGTYYDDQTKVTRKAEDSTSQTNYQKRTYELDGKYMTNATTAQSFANYAIGKYKDPRAELGMGVMNKNATMLTQILSREISDRITIKNTKLGITSRDFFIDYMEHDISISGLLHTATYHLADCINEDFWALDFSKLAEFATSGQTKLGY